MKVLNLKVTISAACLALATTIATPAVAGPSDDECAIWLCLPAAFVVSECRPSYVAMVKRVAKLKPPLPFFGSCVKGPDANQTNASFEHTQSQWEPCRQGYFPIFFRQERFFGREDEVLDPISFRDGGRDDPDRRSCFNYQTGDSYTQSRGPNRHYVTVQVDGVTYDTFSFTP